MATMILLPNATGLFNFNWIAVGETNHHQCLDDDNDGTSYSKCNDDAVPMIIEYYDPDDVTPVNGGVAEAEIDFDETVSVRFISSGKAVHRTNPSLVDIEYEGLSGITAESCSYDAHRTNYETINGTAHTTYDGSNPWTYARLEGLELKCTKDGTVEVYLSYLAIEVTYTATVSAVTDNATFFGANF